MKRLAVLLAALLAGSLNASESVTRQAGVAAGSRYATQAAISSLRAGGSAMDAAVAAAFVLAVTRPDAAGLGGGGLLVYYDKTEDATWSVDFRETAPWSPDESKDEAASEDPPSGILSAGTPGLVRGLKHAHQRFGRSDWKDLVQPAILIAREGFDVDSALTMSINEAKELKTLDPVASAALLGDAKTGIAPTRIVQPDLAATLARLAKDPDDFYEGATASRIVEHSAEAGGHLTIRDLREYQPIWRAPLRIDFGGGSIQTAPPPSRGGVAIASMLAILGGYDLADADLSAPGPMHLFAEAQRRATYDSRRVVADPAYTRVAIASILTAERAAFWRTTIVPDRASSTPSVVAAGAKPSDHTSHISVVDTEGNVASLTVSMSGNFGSGVMVPDTGVILNAALRDFTWKPRPDPNEPEPRKRPATPIAPFILFRQGTPILAAGSSGGDAIPANLTRLILMITKQGSSLREAIAAPRNHQPDYPDRMALEPGTETAAATLVQMGHHIQHRSSIGEINAVMIDGEKIISISDPRGKGSSGGF